MPIALQAHRRPPKIGIQIIWYGDVREQKTLTGSVSMIIFLGPIAFTVIPLMIVRQD